MISTLTAAQKDDRIEALEAENERLRTTIELLEQALGFDDAIAFPLEWGLTCSERRILGFLMRHGIVSRQALMTAVDTGTEMDDRTIDSHIKRARKKLIRFGIQVETLYGEGYYLTPETKAHARTMMAPPTEMRGAA